MGSCAFPGVEGGARSLDGLVNLQRGLSVAVVCGIGDVSNPLGTTSIGMISTVGSAMGICAPRPCAVCGRNPSATC